MGILLSTLVVLWTPKILLSGFREHLAKGSPERQCTVADASRDDARPGELQPWGCVRRRQAGHWADGRQVALDVAQLYGLGERVQSDRRPDGARWGGRDDARREAWQDDQTGQRRRLQARGFCGRDARSSRVLPSGGEYRSTEPSREQGESFGSGPIASDSAPDR